VPLLTLPDEAQQVVTRQYEQRGVPTSRRNIRVEAVAIGKASTRPGDVDLTQVVCVKVRYEDDENGAYVPHVRSIVVKHSSDQWSLAPSESQGDWQQYSCPANAYENH
ncbi:MAG: hypothetical protein LC737_09740, partial [Chloroflexi bacterium]|nr:hypothetical protein [Chloroflexota bacterium]